MQGKITVKSWQIFNSGLRKNMNTRKVMATKQAHCVAEIQGNMHV